MRARVLDFPMVVSWPAGAAEPQVLFASDGRFFSVGTPDGGADPDDFDEVVLAAIDAAVEWGRDPRQPLPEGWAAVPLSEAAGLFGERLQ